MKTPPTSKKPPKLCAYCGLTVKRLTRDHVVPQAFWKDSTLPLRTVTVPACKACQAEWDQDATYFRNLIVVMSDPDDHPAVESLAKGAIVRSFKNDRRNFLDLTRNAARGFHRTPSGIFEPGVRIEVDWTRFNRTPEKIVRGMFFKLIGRPLPETHRPKIFPGSKFWHLPSFQELEKVMSPYQTMGEDVFQLRHLADPGDPNLTVWLMVFFKSTAIFAYTWPNNRQGSPLG